MADSGPPIVTVFTHKPAYWPAYVIQTALCGLLFGVGTGRAPWQLTAVGDYRVISTFPGLAQVLCSSV